MSFLSICLSSVESIYFMYYRWFNYKCLQILHLFWMKAIQVNVALYCLKKKKHYSNILLLLHPQKGTWTQKQPALRDEKRKKCLGALVTPNKPTQGSFQAWLIHLTPWVTSEQQTGTLTSRLQLMSSYFISFNFS